MNRQNILKSKILTLSNLLKKSVPNLKAQIKETTVTIQRCGHGPKWILGLLATEVKSAVVFFCPSNLAIPCSL